MLANNVPLLLPPGSMQDTWMKQEALPAGAGQLTEQIIITFDKRGISR